MCVCERTWLRELPVVFDNEQVKEVFVALWRGLFLPLEGRKQMT